MANTDRSSWAHDPLNKSERGHQGMRARRIRLGQALVVVAVIAAVLAFVRPRSPRPPRLRLIEIYEVKPDGRLGPYGSTVVNLDAKPNTLHGEPDGETRYRRIIADLKARKEVYKDREVRGFRPNGEPIE